MKIKNSIARRVTRRVLIALLIAMAILFTAAYIMVYRETNEEVKTYSKAVLSMYSDIVIKDLNDNDKTLGIEHADVSVYYGEYFCKWYNIDYAYMYIPDPETDTITYICVTARDVEHFGFSDYMIASSKEYKLSAEELAVWNGEQVFAHVTLNNEFGHEIGTIIRVEDEFGNAAIAGVDRAYDDVFEDIAGFFAILGAVIIAVLFGIYFVVYLIIRDKVSKPARAISQSMNSFITDGKKSGEKLEVRGSDEYGMISDAFNSMTDNIDEYLENINTLTRKQANQQTELDIAARIQKGFLPKTALTTEKCEIHAEMLPAKNVGGDLYDHIRLDDSHVLCVIADVSGKGAAASIFMAVTLTLIRQFAKMGQSPAEILKNTNQSLVDNNPSMLFVTAFVGILDTDDNTLVYSNAGHNHPYIVGDGVKTLDGAECTLLGMFEDEEYTQSEIKLKAGDTLFMFTDGVTESINAEKEFFGEEKLESALAQFKASHADDPVALVLEKVREFSKGADQFDDITMLSLTVKETREILLDFNLSEMEKIKKEILSLPISRDDQLKLCLASEECFVNICSYAFDGIAPAGEKIRFTLALSDKAVVRFEDGGMKFDPLREIPSPDDYDIDTQIGGLGRFIAVSSVQDMKYEYKNNKNILTMTIYLEEEKK